MFKKKTICFDIDGIICDSPTNNYKKSKPINKNIKFINKLFKKKFIIKLYTARCMGRFSDNRIKAQKKIENLTIKQLDQWGLKYHKIFFGKPSFDILVDDKSIFFKKNWDEFLIKKLK